MLKQLLCVGFLLFGLNGVYGTELEIKGNFKLPEKTKLPEGWRMSTGSQGTIEVVQSEDSVHVMLDADAATKGRIGIYSLPIKAKAGDNITVSARVIGEKIKFLLYQYGKNQTSSLQKELKGDADGSLLSHTFTVTDGSKSPTETVRVAFSVENGGSAAISKVNAKLE